MLKVNFILGLLIAPIVLFGQLENQHLNKALKITPLSYFFNTFSLSLEHSYKKLRTVEYTLGVIGVNNKNADSSINSSGFLYYIKEQKGAFARFGWKQIFKRGLNFNNHDLGGTYLKFETGISLYKYYEYKASLSNSGKVNFVFEEHDHLIHAFNLMVGLGQQLVLGKRWVFNGYAAVGPNFSNYNSFRIYDDWQMAPYNSGLYPSTGSRFSTLLVFNVGYTFK